MNRRFRLFLSLAIAMVLSTFLVYTAVAGGDVQQPVVEAHELDTRAGVARSTTVELVGVAAGPVRERSGDRMSFFITDRRGGNRTAVSYAGAVPDAFRVGRHVVVRGRLRGSTFRAERGSLVTKCPSKFESAGKDA